MRSHKQPWKFVVVYGFAFTAMTLGVVLYMELRTAAKQPPKIPYMLDDPTDDPTNDLHIMTHTMTQTKCGDLNFVEVLKVMKTPKGFECRNRPGRTANYRRRRDQQ